MVKEQITTKQFLMNVLNAVGAGVVIALLPNALLGEFLKFFKDGNQFLEIIYQWRHYKRYTCRNYRLLTILHITK